MVMKENYNFCQPHPQTEADTDSIITSCIKRCVDKHPHDAT